MTQEIKQRIEQIRRGEVPLGYKKTKIGIVPSEWERQRLGSHLIKYNKISTYCDQYPVLTSSRRGIFLQSEYYKKNIASEDNTGYNVVPYGYFTYRHMSDDEVFKFNINIIVKNGIVSTLYPVFTTKSIDDIFLREILNEGREFRRYALLQKQGGSRTYMYFAQLEQLQVFLPNIEEQQKIASVLTTCDKVIELKEKLIAEKQRQKKWLMQNLLTGKKRLAGFVGEWKVVRAKNIFENVSCKNHSGTQEVLSATQDRGIIPRSAVDIDIKFDKSLLTGYKEIRKGDYVISLRSFQGGIEYSEYDGIVSPAYTVLRAKLPIADGYYKAYFKSVDYISHLTVAVYGIRDGKQISYADFGFIEMPYPSIKEQTAIAEILSTADHEIELLQKELNQYKQQKKALMQLLLTGIVRVNM